jgi:hypothetical protein
MVGVVQVVRGVVVVHVVRLILLGVWQRVLLDVPVLQRVVLRGGVRVLLVKVGVVAALMVGAVAVAVPVVLLLRLPLVVVVLLLLLLLPLVVAVLLLLLVLLRRLPVVQLLPVGVGIMLRRRGGVVLPGGVVVVVALDVAMIMVEVVGVVMVV